MKQLTLSLEDEICLINKYGLDATDLLVVRTILIYQEEQSNILFNLISALKQCKIDFREILVKLQSKGIITKEYKIPNKGETFNPLDIAINKNVIKTIYKGSFELGKELFEVYPQFGTINGCVKYCATKYLVKTPLIAGNTFLFLLFLDFINFSYICL